MNLSDMPHFARMRLREALEATGAQIEGYDGPDFQVALPRYTGGPTTFTKLNQAGFEVIGDSLYFFPLGSDQAPEEMRHDGNYKGSRAFWLYARVRPVDRSAILEPLTASR